MTAPLVALAQGHRALPCAGQDVGGAWPSYGHDADNTRTQPAETTIGPSAAAGLAKRWVFTTAGALQSTPVVSHGCVYVTTDTGNVYAIDAGTGQQVWHVTLPVTSSGLGGAIPGAPAVVGNRVIVLVAQAGAPYAAALDARTGTLMWRSAPVSTEPGVYTNASAAVDHGVLVFGYSPPEGADGAQGGVSLLDVRTGAILADVPTVPLADQAKGYAGGGIWSTAAFDRDGYAYVGSGNPFSKTEQDPRTDAVLKIDVNRHRSTFGRIVGFAPGNVDQYSDSLRQLSQTPVCAASDTGMQWPLDDPACGQLDLDFGASPNLFPDGHGGMLIGDLQKSGEYHTAHAADMSEDWSTTVGASCAVCNAASTAYDGTSLYVVGTPGGALWSLSPRTGATNWVTPVADGVHYQSVSTADGVVYTVDGNGCLDAWSAADGAVILKHPLLPDTGAPVSGPLSSSGVSIADHSVFVATSGLASTLAGNSVSVPDNGYLISYGIN